MGLQANCYACIILAFSGVLIQRLFGQALDILESLVHPGSDKMDVRDAEAVCPDVFVSRSKPTNFLVSIMDNGKHSPRHWSRWSSASRARCPASCTALKAC